MIKKLSPLFLLLLLFSCTNENLVTPLEKESTTEKLDPLESKKPPVGCNIPCTTPDYVNVSMHGDCGFAIDWGYENIEPACGDFIILLQDHNTGVHTTYHATVPPFLTPTLPCGDFTIKVSHLSSNCASVFYTTNFSNNAACCVPPPSYCEATGLNPTCLHSGYIHFVTGDVWEEVHTLDYQDQGYVDLTSVELNIAPNEVIDATLLGICHCLDIGATIYERIWIDFDQNSSFDYYELVFSNSHYMSGGTGAPNPNPLLDCGSWDFPGFTFPDREACGLRARYIITTDPFVGPCSTFSTGQVVDFTINSMPGC